MSEKKSENTRWWEFYVVRYFVGTVVGALVLLWLSRKNGDVLSGLLPEGVKFDWSSPWLLGALGLAYCYIASAPILVLHATRGAIFSPSHQRFFSWALALPAGLSACASGVGLVTQNKELVFYTLAFTVLWTQAVPIGHAVRTRMATARSHYEALTAQRSRDSEQVRQFVESYKHLREHGNAFFILLFEVVFGLILGNATSSAEAGAMLLLWTLPATLVWVLATELEYGFAFNPLP